MKILLAALLIISVTGGVYGCEPSRIKNGCRIQEGRCLCGTGCDTEYRYANKLECDSALRGRANDRCSPNPCKNGGVCLQVLTSRVGFNCLCAETGYYGELCEKRCPRRRSLRPDEKYPTQCIVI